MRFYVVGGMYEDTTFRRLLREDPAAGPFATYEEALSEWSARSRTSLDFATVRYFIVEADERAGGAGPLPGAPRVPRDESRCQVPG